MTAVRRGVRHYLHPSQRHTPRHAKTVATPDETKQMERSREQD